MFHKFNPQKVLQNSGEYQQGDYRTFIRRRQSSQVSILGNLSKLTRRPRGGGQQANLHSIDVRGRMNSLGL